MKKPRHLLLMIVSVVMALALAFTVACSGSCSSCSSCSSCGEAKVTSIELDTTEVKTEYYTGETFTSEGLKITAVYSNKKTDDTLTAESEGVSIDRAAYKKNAVGTYEIKVSYTEGDATCDASYTVNVNEVTLSVDTSTVQVLYIVNEDNFSTDNLVVKRTVTTPTETTTTTLSASDYTLDNGGFNKAKVGTYVVTANSTYDGRAISASYTTRVIEPRQGLEVTLKGDCQDKATITLEGTTSEVDVANLSEAASWIQVRQPDQYGVVAANAPVVDASKYTVKIYQGQNEVTDLATLGGGAYTIWVTMDGEDNDGEPFKYYGFQLIYVIDDLVSIKWDEDAAGTQTEQLAGKNTISKTWQFTATYASGKQETITGIDKLLKADGSALSVSTATVGDDLTVTVYYKTLNAKRVATTKSCDVTYTVKPLSGTVNYTLNYKVQGEAWVSEWGEYEGAASQVSVVGTTSTFKSSSKSTTDGSVTLSEYTELKKYQSNNSLVITVGSAAQNVNITVYASHTSSDARTMYLATATTETDTSKVIDSITVGGTGLDKAKLHTLTATNAAAGTYYVFTNNTTMHVYAVKVTYSINYDEESQGNPFEDFSSAGFKENISSGLASDLEWTSLTSNADAKVTILNGSKISESSKKFTIDGNETSIAYRVQTAGANKTNQKSIKIEINKAATVTVYYCPGNTNIKLTVLDKDGANIYTGDASANTNPTTEEITLNSAGTYYFGADTSGINVYYIRITYNA